MLSPICFYDNHLGRYTFNIKKYDNLYYVDISFCKKGDCYPLCWIHSILNGKIVPRQDNLVPITDDVNKYFSKLFKLKAFI